MQLINNYLGTSYSRTRTCIYDNEFIATSFVISDHHHGDNIKVKLTLFTERQSEIIIQLLLHPDSIVSFENDMKTNHVPFDGPTILFAIFSDRIMRMT